MPRLSVVRKQDVPSWNVPPPKTSGANLQIVQGSKVQTESENPEPTSQDGSLDEMVQCCSSLLLSLVWVVLMGLALALGIFIPAAIIGGLSNHYH